jgi:hypothetical protein
MAMSMSMKPPTGSNSQNPLFSFSQRSVIDSDLRFDRIVIFWISIMEFSGLLRSVSKYKETCKCSIIRSIISTVCWRINKIIAMHQLFLIAKIRCYWSSSCHWDVIWTWVCLIFALKYMNSSSQIILLFY